MADRRRIVQVLSNLLSNAARHAPESTPIRIADVREDAHVAVSVSDERSGVAPELMPHLFSKHARARQSAAAGRAGVPPTAPEPGEPPRILVVDDDPRALRVVRVRAALRRREEPEPFVVGDLAIDYARRRATLGGDAVDLTATEYELLRVLSLDAGRVVTFETLLRRVWAKPDSAGANLVRNFVRNVRRKLGESTSSPTNLLNERGVGYRMAKPPNQ